VEGQHLRRDLCVMAYLRKGGIEGRISGVAQVKLCVSCCSLSRVLARGRHRRLLCIEEPVPWKITSSLQVLLQRTLMYPCTLAQRGLASNNVTGLSDY
jgi:hypothetical protein